MGERIKNFPKNPPPLAPAVGFEPTTNRLTVDRSTAELRWNNGGVMQHFSASDCNQKFTPASVRTQLKKGTSHQVCETYLLGF